MKMTVTRKRARTIIYPLWVAGSSAGAVTAALIAGNRKTDRIERLREFWNFPLQRRSGQPFAASVRLWMGAIRTRLTGSAGHFHPRIPSVNPYGFRSLYDLAPMQARMARLIDFGNLNSGETRIHRNRRARHFRFQQDENRNGSPLGELRVPARVRTGRNWRPAVRRRWSPFDPSLEGAPDSDLVLYVVDLYPLDGGRPKSLEAAAERKNDLLFRQSNCPQAETSYSVAERLAAGNVPFAFVTGYGEFGIKAEFRDRPVISKPLNEVNLAATLRLMRPA